MSRNKGAVKANRKRTDGEKLRLFVDKVNELRGTTLMRKKGLRYQFHLKGERDKPVEFTLEEPDEGILRSLRTQLQAAQWYHTLLQFEVASLAQKEGWQLQLELPYNNDTNNKSDVCLRKGETQLLIDAVSIRLSESGRKKQAYFNWLTNMSIQYGVNITGRIGEPWLGGRKEEQQWIQRTLKTLLSVYQSGLIAVVHSPRGGSLECSRAAYGKTGMVNIHDADTNEDIWERIRRALGDKDEQASGNLVWLRMGEYAGLWHWSRYRNKTLEEKLSNLSPMIQTALESFPHIAGVILSPGISPVYYPEAQTPCKISPVGLNFIVSWTKPCYHILNVNKLIRISRGR